MPFNRPSLPDLIARIQADIEARIAGAAPSLRRSVLGVIARALAGVTHGLHGHLDWVSRQILPDTAEHDYLIRHAAWRGITPLPAAAAVGQAQALGVDGSVIPVGTLYLRADGLRYLTTSEATVAGGSATLTLQAETAGQASNTGPGLSLTAVSAVPGVQSRVTLIGDGLTGGADAEETEALRARLRQRVQSPARGGHDDDYVAWALEVPGVTRAWAYRLWTGAGTVGIFVMRDLDDSPIPDSAEVAAVQAHIDTLRPATAAPTVYAPIAAPVDMTIQLEPNTTAVQSAVLAELADLLARDAEPEDGTGSGTIPLSRIREAISSADGESDHAVSLSTDVTVAKGEIATLGTVTWGAL